MISKNRPCPCGSGKLYKRCCGLEQKGKKNVANPFGQYSTFDILQNVAALSLIPENHGKNLRLENAAREAVRLYNTNARKITKGELQIYLNKHYSADPMEDPPANLFTEVIAFHGGDYLVLPGITESPAFLLNNLASAIFNWPTSNLKHEFKSNVSHIIHAILTLSNRMLQKASLSRYMRGVKRDERISFPSNDVLALLTKAIWFSEEEMEKLMKEDGINKEALKLFLADINDPAFKDTNIEESPFISKPLLRVKNGYLVVSPATLCYALINRIKDEARVWDCSDEMHKTFHALVWNSMQLNFKRLNFKPIYVPGLQVPDHEFVRTFICSFDDDKIAIIRYIPMSQPAKSPSPEEIAKSNEELFIRIKSIKEFAHYQFMDLTIPSVLANDLMYGIIGNKVSRSLAINSFCFDLLSSSHKCTALDLWKFSHAREAQVPKFAKMSGLTFLDEFSVYKNHQDSFYLSDEGFDLSKWRYGASQSLIEEIKQRNDEHCMAIRIEGRLAKTYVLKRDKYSPIYLSIMDLAAQELQFAIEGFGTSVWVKPIQVENASDAINHFYWELTDTITYWLWQICEDVKSYLQAIDPNCVFFNFKLDNSAKFEEPDDSFRRDPDILKKLSVTSSETEIHLTIPHELIAYFYGADNEGDRLLVRQILLGINDSLRKKNIPLFTDNMINTIIEKYAPLGTKKKLLIMHSRSNLLLDGRNLQKPRYVKEYDVSTTANNIGKLLGSDCPPVGEITDPEEKKKLTRNIVMRGLLPHLKSTIDQYDNERLIQRLIALNESLIHDREHQRIKTPTRIACFVSQDVHTEDMIEIMGDINRTTIAVRCLLEHLAAEPAKGNRAVSKAGIDELIGIMDAIINWGSIGDQLTFSLFDIKIGILKTGRIGTQKNIAREIFDPYHFAKTREDVEDAINSFKQEFPQSESETAGKEIPSFLDTAFVAEFNISFSRICTFIDILADQGFQQNTAYAAMDRKTLLAHALNYVEPFSENEFNHALNFLGLVNRGTVENIPKGYEGFDISPWRFNRRLSLLRRPIIIYDTDDPTNPQLYWGPRQALQSRITLAEQCMHDRLKVSSNKSPVKKAMSRLTNERGTGFVKSIIEKLNIPDTILDTEVTISKSGKLKNHSDIGDVDVLLIALKAKRLYSLECKNFAPSRNIKEMIEECEKLMGSRSEKGLIEKHSIRHEWIKQNLKQVGLVYKQDLSGFEVKSAIITREDMLFRHLKHAAFEIPFITRYDLMIKGYECLKSL